MHELNRTQATIQGLKVKYTPIVIELYDRQAAFDAGRLPRQALEQAQAKYDETMPEWKSYQNDINFDFHATKNETSTAHFFRPPKKVLYNVPILEVQDADGTVSTCPQVIHDVFHAKWSAVMCENDFQAPNRASRRRFLRLLQKRLTNEQRDSLDSPITTYELAQAIKTMAPHKSPGMDGFPAAFYQLEADLFAEILCLVFKYQLSRGELLGIQRRSAVSLLFKGGDRSNPGNYRPIALIPVEVKILTRALAYRLRDLLPALIHPIQTGFVAGRRIHDHIIFLKDLQHKCTLDDIEGYAMFLDFEKAYDRVNWDFMYDVLEAFNFGPVFISWIKLMYHSPIIHLVINGELSQAIYPRVESSKGILCRHCCLSSRLPFSEELFAMAMFFADDTTLVSSSLEDLERQLELVQEFCTQSDVPRHPRLSMVTSGTPTKYLGILFGHRLSDQVQINALSDSFYQSFITWGCRARTLRAVIHIPEDTIAKWQSMVYKFILARKRHKEDKHMSLINSGVAYHPSLGLRIPHIASRIRAQRVQRLQLLVQTDNEEPSLSVLPKQLIRRCMEPFARHSSWDCLIAPIVVAENLGQLASYPLTRKCPETPTQSHLLTMSIWLQVHPLFLVPGSNGPTSLAVALKHHRPFYKFLAQEGLHCLDDFVTAQRVWPSYEEFKLQMESHVWRFPGDDFPRVFRHLYSLLSLIATNVWQVLGISLEEAVPPNRDVQFPSDKFGRMSLFLSTMAAQVHPIDLLLCATTHQAAPHVERFKNNDLAIKKYINTSVKPLMRYPSPLQADVWWRILFRMLPVNSRFFFLQDTNPSIIECSYPGCSAVETMQHILFDCKFVKPVWNWHQAAWRPFGIPFTWNTIINLDEFAVSEEWVPHFSVIRRLWVLLVSTLLRDF
ncbi:hypothetical protein Ae201684P_019074 [Aphanomyces euteiches]|nr:hypothetical protein Ae201684P_019074 [Aphanomyces euteiches]